MGWEEGDEEVGRYRVWCHTLAIPCLYARKLSAGKAQLMVINEFCVFLSAV